jgi:hypothetical protein
MLKSKYGLFGIFFIVFVVLIALRFVWGTVLWVGKTALIALALAVVFYIIISLFSRTKR